MAHEWFRFPHLSFLADRRNHGITIPAKARLLDFACDSALRGTTGVVPADLVDPHDAVDSELIRRGILVLDAFSSTYELPEIKALASAASSHARAGATARHARATPSMPEQQGETPSMPEQQGETPSMPEQQGETPSMPEVADKKRREEKREEQEDPPPPSGESSDGQFHKIPSCEKKAGKFDPLSVELPACIPYEVWSDWVAYRKEKKKPLTETTVRLQLKKLATLSDPVAALTRSMANGWIGFDFDGGTPRTPPQPPEDDFSFEAAKAKAEQVGARMAAMMREGTL